MSNAAASAEPLEANVPTRLTQVVVDLSMALLFLIVWIAPWDSGLFSVREAMILLVVEALTVLAALFVGIVVIDSSKGGPGLPASVRLGMVALIGVAFVGFAAAFGLVEGLWSPAIAMAVLFYDKFGAAGRLLRMKGDAYSQQSRHLAIQWGVRLPLLMLSLVVAGLLPWPSLGLPSANEVGDVLTGAATLTFIVGGFLYFTATAAVRYFATGWLLRNVNRVSHR